MSMRLIECLATTPALAEVFSDESVLRAMLDFEAALARAEARVGIIPKDAADTITALAKPGSFDTPALATAAFRAGTPAIPLVKALTDQVRKTNAEAARFVHWGATSQDVMDSAISLLLKRAEPILIGDLIRLERALKAVSERHKDSVMVGRTLLQSAPPITFGLKAAGWLGSVSRGRHRLQDGIDNAAMLQFGGASGTLASLGDHGASVIEALSVELGLKAPAAGPWHTQRDQVAALICACGVLTGSLGKMARDVSLLMQNEVGEASEPGSEGRGGSSTMPNKRNPTACSLALAAAYRVPGLVASFLSAMVQEHERGVGGLQAEWPVVAAVVQLTGVAITSMAELAEGLSVDTEKMRVNILQTNGLIFAERAMMLLGPKLGRDVAHKILEGAARKSVKEGRNLAAVLAEIPEVTAHLSVADLKELERPEQYLGSAEAFRKAVLTQPDPNRTTTTRSNDLPFATVRNARMFYRLQGNAGRPVLILSHSIGTDHSMWDLQVADLLPHFQILRYDTRGHGASDAPAGEYSIEMLAGDILGLTDALGIPHFAFCGLSLGGAIGQWVAAHAPQRVTHLVLANTSPQFVPRSNWESRIAAVRKDGMSAIVDLAMSRLFLPDTLAKENPHAASIRSVLLGTDPVGYTGCCAALRDVNHGGLAAADSSPGPGDRRGS